MGEESTNQSAGGEKAPVVLVIRDGWGINPNGHKSAKEDGNATLLAHTPFHDHLYATYPMSRLSASGEDVGLPAGQMGNSEVGHLNLGAGRIVYQDLLRINNAIDDGSLLEREALKDALREASQNNSRLHLYGLISDGGVHSHQAHMVALAKAAHEAGVKEIFVHAFTDGRDTSPTGGKDYLQWCEENLHGLRAEIVTVCGRYYAMDRDKRWDRTRLAWDAMVHGHGKVITDKKPHQAIAACYEDGTTDEFLKPMIFGYANEQRVRDGDVIICFNFRADRVRQLSAAILEEDFAGFDRGTWPRVKYCTMTEYDKNYGVPVIFGSETMPQILGEVVSAAGKNQLRIAETEKYPHVTYFFNGGEEVAFHGEDREIIPSPKEVATYDEKPEMSAEQLTDTLIPRLKDYDLVILNFANPDMVGHTGVVDAGIKACETIDRCLKRVIEEILRLGGKALVTADHGNAERMRNPDGSPNTAHTTFLVHFIYVGANHEKVELEDGILADVAPTLLHLLAIDKPEEMSGHSLIAIEN